MARHRRMQCLQPPDWSSDPGSATSSCCVISDKLPNSPSLGTLSYKTAVKASSPPGNCETGIQEHPCWLQDPENVILLSFASLTRL